VKRLLAVAVLLAALAPRPAGSSLDVLLFDAVSASSGTATPVRTAGYAYLRVQVCGGTGGDAFSGTVSIKQGARTATIVETLSLTLSGVEGCVAANYRTLNPSLVTGASYTRSGGKLTLYLEGQ